MSPLPDIQQAFLSDKAAWARDAFWREFFAAAGVPTNEHKEKKVSKLIEHIKAGGAVRTRSGKEVRILRTDMTGTYPLVGLLKNDSGADDYECWTNRGRWSTAVSSPRDLVPVPQVEAVYGAVLLHATNPDNWQTLVAKSERGLKDQIADWERHGWTVISTFEHTFEGPG